MKRKILLKILGLTFLSLFLFFSAGIAIVYGHSKTLLRERLTMEADLVAGLLDEAEDFEAFEAYYQNDELRVTVISTTGEVLFESDTQASLENHLQREEVQSALLGTPKMAERYSQTFECTMNYYAVLDTLADGTVVIVRLALRGSEISSYVLTCLPFFLLSLVVCTALGGLLAKKLSKEVSGQIVGIADSLKSLNEGQYRPLQIKESEPEFASVLKEINELSEGTHNNILREKDIIRQKSEFFANASHELKTPITVMRGLTEILLSKESLEEQEKKQITRIHKESLRMAELISDMLKLSKLERSEPEECVEVELRELAEEVVAELADSIEEKNLEVALTGAGKVFAAPKNIFELIQNLCSNAVNYNKRDGWIKIAIEQQGENVVLRVADGGIGIEEEHIPRLCERFYRVDKSRSKKTGGTGLGLAIVKHICVLYGAELEITSTPNVGTAVSVKFAR